MRPRTALLAAAAIIGVYLPVALWLQHSYVPSEIPGTVFELKRQFSPIDGLAWYGLAPALDAEADDVDQPRRSPYVVYVNDRLLGPAHTFHSEIVNLGHGRFSHWKGIGFIISSSDGTNPESNGRQYRVVLPDDRR